MPTDAKDDTRTYIVLVKHEGQYSLCLAGREIPPGGWPWARLEPGHVSRLRQAGVDLTPLSLRLRRDPASAPA